MCIRDRFIPGQTVADPSCIEQSWEALYATTLDSIRNPIGMPTLTQLAHKMCIRDRFLYSAAENFAGAGPKEGESA